MIADAMLPQRRPRALWFFERAKPAAVERRDMARKEIAPTNVEVFFDKDDIIVSKTDLKGHITYANKTFCEIAGYTEREVVGQPHSIIRHPEMPRAVFKLLWDTL